MYTHTHTHTLGVNKRAILTCLHRIEQILLLSGITNVGINELAKECGSVMLGMNKIFKWLLYLLFSKIVEYLNGNLKPIEAPGFCDLNFSTESINLRTNQTKRIHYNTTTTTWWPLIWYMNSIKYLPSFHWQFHHLQQRRREHVWWNIAPHPSVFPSHSSLWKDQPLPPSRKMLWEGRNFLSPSD